MALNDCQAILSAARHTKPEKIKQKFEEELASVFETVSYCGKNFIRFCQFEHYIIFQNFLDKLCELIENDLRLCIHTHLQLEDRNPFSVQLRVCTPLLNVPALRFGNRYFDVKRK